MAAPTMQAVGNVMSSTGPLTVPWPTHAVDDVALLFVESANEAVTLTTANGFVAVTNQGTGTAGTASATALYVFWCRATSTSMAAPVVADSGRRQTAFIMTFRGCIATGNPWDVLAGNVQATTSTAVSIPTVTTTVVNALIVNALSNSLAPTATTVQPASLANVNLANLSKRKNTQSDGTGGIVTGGKMPVGWMAFGSGGAFGDVGEGPDLTTANPATACLFAPNISTIGAQIDAADLGGIVLFLNFAGNKQTYTTTVNGVPTLDMGKYQANLRKFRPDSDNTAFPDRLKLADAIRRRRVINYVVDEPNLNNATNPTVPDITPTQANQMGLLHKTQWANDLPLTAVRVPAETMASGWKTGAGSFGVPPGGWTGFDYCWSQYTLRHGRGDANNQPWTTPVSPVQLMADQRQIIADGGLDLGVLPSLNMYRGGIGLDTLGVTARWDTDGPGGSGALNYVGGDNDANAAGTITTLTTSVKSLMANPNWIRKFAELMAQDSEIPCCFYWQHTTASGASNEYLSYYQRSDLQSAFSDAIDFGNARTSFSGWRDAK